MASHRARVFPTELLERPRWIRHKAKRPLHPNGYWISVTEPSNLSDYQTAKASKYGDGLGFVLNGDGIICIDLDHCFDKKPNEAAQALIDSLPSTYIEISPSGTGVHIRGLASMDSCRRLTRNGLSVEIYPAGRYITMTGNVLHQAPLAQLDVNSIVNG